MADEGKMDLWLKIALVAALAAFVVAFKLLGLDSYLSFEYLKQSQDKFSVYYSDNAPVVIGLYMLVYITTTALSLPGAAVLTLAGGALFGLVIGTVVVSFASTIGATLACLVSRFLLRDWVQERFRERVGAINRGIEAEGAFYLFTLRLIPVFPFFVINLVMGLTRMRAWTFYWVSQAGMLAGTMVYVNAGKELGQLEGIEGILSPGLLMSFALLGVFPITVKKLMGAYRKRKGLTPAGS
jgi:uncharacterized membrane protein YdjX (TVP38/TMEM64 family)